MAGINFNHYFKDEFYHTNALPHAVRITFESKTYIYVLDGYEISKPVKALGFCRFNSDAIVLESRTGKALGRETVSTTLEECHFDDKDFSGMCRLHFDDRLIAFFDHSLNLHKIVEEWLEDCGAIDAVRA